MDHLGDTLTGQFLIAAPGILDERFQKSLIYIFSHSQAGASGLMINRPCDFIDFPDLCDQLDIIPKINTDSYPLLEGGPVESNRGYVLHTDDFTGRDTTHIEGTSLHLTTTVDVIKQIAEAESTPKKSLICLGYAGWDAGQLEKELTSHGWLHADAIDDIIFDTPYANKWDAAIESLGFNASGLVEYTGTA